MTTLTSVASQKFEQVKEYLQQYAKGHPVKTVVGIAVIGAVAGVAFSHYALPALAAALRSQSCYQPAATALFGSEALGSRVFGMPAPICLGADAIQPVLWALVGIQVSCLAMAVPLVLSSQKSSQQ
ncbi:MAG TPA: hypothetical protein VLE89_06000 [Chlamydiales bacterium]|nr:hypothetical protein [Chlamydiales bacterium]